MVARRGLPPLPKTLLPNGKRPCRGCGGELPPRRSRWCGDECKERAYMALSSHARSKVWQRDKGVCELCGWDTGFIGRLYWFFRKRDDMEAFGLLVSVSGIRRTQWSGWHVPNLWEADHRVPLVLGGTNDLSNYRTLCITCHKEQTALLARVRSKRGRQQGLQLT